MKSVHWLFAGLAAALCVVFAGLSWRQTEAYSGTVPTVAAKKPARKAAKPAAKAKASRRPASVRNLPKGAIKLTERDYAADRLFDDDLP